MDNEWNHIHQKLMRGLVVAIENQARMTLRQRPRSGGATRRGAATTFPGSLVHSNAILIEGSNMAECHPVAFRWVMQAKLKGARIIHADPRFTRTTAVADLHAPIRAGSDIAFLGGLINYVINSERWNSEPFFREYVTTYTNAATIINEGFLDTRTRPRASRSASSPDSVRIRKGSGASTASSVSTTRRPGSTPRLGR